MCSHAGCSARAIAGGGACFAHSSDDEREQYLTGFKDPNVPIDLSDTLITEASLDWLFARFAQAPITTENQPLPIARTLYRAALPTITFRGATFLPGVTFDRVAFNMLADFRDAHFRDVSFARAAFLDGATFANATFGGSAIFEAAGFYAHWTGQGTADASIYPGESVRFTSATFERPASFDRTTFQSFTDFRACQWHHDVTFLGCRLGAAVRLSGARVDGMLTMRNTESDAGMWFDGATLSTAVLDGIVCDGELGLRHTRFGGSVAMHNVTARRLDLTGATFDSELALAPAKAQGALSLVGTTLYGPATLDLTASGVTCSNMRVAATTTVVIRARVITLDGASFSGPTMVRGAPDEDESAPKVISMRHLNATNLVLRDVDLTGCHLASVHNLDDLRMERGVILAATPSGFTRGRRPSFLFRWTPRRVIREEVDWRVGVGAVGWKKPPPQPTDSISTTDDHIIEGWAVAALKRARDQIEARFKTTVTDEAIEFAVASIRRYFSDSALPERALHVLQEAVMTSWRPSRTRDPELRALATRVDEVRVAKEEAIASQDFERAAHLRDVERRLTNEMREREGLAEDAAERAVEQSLTSGERPAIGAEEVAVVVAEWTGETPAEVLDAWNAYEPTSADDADSGAATTGPGDDEARTVNGGTTALAQPTEIAEVYRALRRGREAESDAPGASEFYYGEMEMRRRSGPAAGSISGMATTGERMVIALYWLVSGYGVRATRALACLIVTVLVGAYLLDQFGFPASAASRPNALLFSLESTISLLRTPQTVLTFTGEIVSIVLRLLGPLFFGLTLLALRGRVKR